MCFLFVSRNFYWLFNAVPSMDVFGANWTSVYSLKLRKMFGIPRFSVKQWTIRWSCIRWAISIITCQCVEFHWKYDDCEWFLVINCNLALLLFLAISGPHFVDLNGLICKSQPIYKGKNCTTATIWTNTPQYTFHSSSINCIRCNW